MCPWENCIQNGCEACYQWTKTKNVLMIQSAVWSCSKQDFICRCVTMDETWIHHYTPESLCQSAEWTQVGESRPKWPNCKCWPVRFWTRYFGMRAVFYSFTVLRMEKPSTVNITCYYRCVKVKLQETAPNAKGERALLSRQCAMSQVVACNGKIVLIKVSIASPSQQLLPQKML